MEWLKKLYKDKLTKWVTIFCLIGGPAFEVGQFYANKWIYGNEQWQWDTIIFTYIFFFMIFLPVAFLYRNAE